MCIYFLHESCEIEIDTQRSDWKLSSRGPQVYVMRGCLIWSWGTGWAKHWKAKKWRKRMRKASSLMTRLFLTPFSCVSIWRRWKRHITCRVHLVGHVTSKPTVIVSWSIAVIWQCWLNSGKWHNGRGVYKRLNRLMWKESWWWNCKCSCWCLKSSVMRNKPSVHCHSVKRVVTSSVFTVNCGCSWTSAWLCWCDLCDFITFIGANQYVSKRFYVLYCLLKGFHFGQTLISILKRDAFP